MILTKYDLSHIRPLENEKKRATNIPKPVTYRGVEYPSVGALAREIGMNDSTLASRLKRFDTVEEACEAPLKPTSPRLAKK